MNRLGRILSLVLVVGFGFALVEVDAAAKRRSPHALTEEAKLDTITIVSREVGTQEEAWLKWADAKIEEKLRPGLCRRAAVGIGLVGAGAIGSAVGVATTVAATVVATRFVEAVFDRDLFDLLAHLLDIPVYQVEKAVVCMFLAGGVYVGAVAIRALLAKCRREQAKRVRAAQVDVDLGGFNDN
jgi:hypothetical protein